MRNNQTAWLGLKHWKGGCWENVCFHTLCLWKGVEKGSYGNIWTPPRHSPSGRALDCISGKVRVFWWNKKSATRQLRWYKSSLPDIPVPWFAGQRVQTCSSHHSFPLTAASLISGWRIRWWHMKHPLLGTHWTDKHRGLVFRSNGSEHHMDAGCWGRGSRSCKMTTLIIEGTCSHESEGKIKRWMLDWIDRGAQTNTGITKDLKNLAAYSEVLVATVMLLPSCKPQQFLMEDHWHRNQPSVAQCLGEEQHQKGLHMPAGFHLFTTAMRQSWCSQLQQLWAPTCFHWLTMAVGKCGNTE